jgi:uncharacterized protein (DUF849 family)/NAD(P)-dependent dehydrogenase (short-subunit alcohol dehydrogenase family)
VQTAAVLAAEFPGAGHIALPADVGDTASLLAMRDALQVQWGEALHILVNAAGFIKPVPDADLDALDDALIDRMFAVNWRGQFAAIRTFVPMLKASGDGLIVSISSIAGQTGIGSSIAYCAVKAGIDVMTKSPARALAPEIRVVGVAPGVVDTSFVPGPDVAPSSTPRPPPQPRRAASPRQMMWPRQCSPARRRSASPPARRSSSTVALPVRLPMRRPLPRIFITAAVTGNLSMPEQTPHLPITLTPIPMPAWRRPKPAPPSPICMWVILPPAARPWRLRSTGRSSSASARNPDLILNLTTGPGGRYVPSKDDPAVAGRPWHYPLAVRGEGRAHLSAAAGHLHARPQPDELRRLGRDQHPGKRASHGRIIREAGAKPEIELFDSGDIALLQDLITEGTLDHRPLCSFVMGVRYGFQPSVETMLYVRSIGRHVFPMAAQSYLAGGHVRVGIEDGVHLSRGVPASGNAAMVTRIRSIIEALGAEIATPAQTREILGLPQRAS